MKSNIFALEKMEKVGQCAFFISLEINTCSEQLLNKDKQQFIFVINIRNLGGRAFKQFLTKEIFHFPCAILHLSEDEPAVL